MTDTAPYTDPEVLIPDEAKAMVAAAYASAADEAFDCWDHGVHPQDYQRRIRKLTPDDARAELDRLLADAEERGARKAVKVKPLSWRDSYGVLRAETPFGDYKVTGKVLHHLGNPGAQSAHSSTAEAQAAAQANYEASILSALDRAINPEDV